MFELNCDNFIKQASIFLKDKVNKMRKIKNLINRNKFKQEVPYLFNYGD